MAGKRRDIGELESLSVEPGFWDDPQRAQRVMRQINGLRDQVESWEAMRSQVDEGLKQIDPPGHGTRRAAVLWNFG